MNQPKKKRTRDNKKKGGLVEDKKKEKRKTERRERGGKRGKERGKEKGACSYFMGVALIDVMVALWVLQQ